MLRAAGYVKVFPVPRQPGVIAAETYLCGGTCATPLLLCCMRNHGLIQLVESGCVLSTRFDEQYLGEHKGGGALVGIRSAANE